MTGVQYFMSVEYILNHLIHTYMCYFAKIYYKPFTYLRMHSLSEYASSAFLTRLQTSFYGAGYFINFLCCLM